MGRGARIASFIFVPLMLVLAVFAAVIVVDEQRRKQRTADAFDRLYLVHQLKATALEDLLISVRTEIKSASNSSKIIETLIEMNAAWVALGSGTEILRKTYLSTSATDTSKVVPVELTDTGANALKAYDRYHHSFDRWAKRFLAHFGYYDIFLINLSGDVLYTQAKEDDFGTNLLNGKLRATSLADAVRQALKTHDEVMFSDFERYSPSAGAPAAFAATAVRGPDGKPLGAIAVQLPREPIEELLEHTDGIGKTGETYAVGSDLLMRNQSRFIKTPTLLVTMVDTRAVTEGLAGRNGSGRILDYRGKPVLSVWRKVSFGSAPWVLIAEIDEGEVLDGDWLSLFSATPGRSN